jgi:adenylyl cyclase-associated protein
MIRLEAVASRFEDLEETKGTGHSKRRSTSTVTSAGLAETPSASAPPPPPPPPPPPVIEVPSESPRAVIAYDEIIIEGKLKAFLEINKAIAPPPLNEQVILSHVFLFFVLKTRGHLG